MLDYLYQLDYKFKAESRNGFAAEEEHALSTIPEPELPDARAIDRFEDLAVEAPQQEAADDSWPGPRLKKSSKKKKRASLFFDQVDLSATDSKSTALPDSPLGDFGDTEFSIHAKVYALADKYGIHDLKDLAQAKFAEAASRDWNSSSFPHAIQTVYLSTPESNQGLRDIVVNTISQHKELLEKAEVETFVKEINGLAFGLLQSAWGLRQAPASSNNLKFFEFQRAEVNEW